ncbi:hydroxymethylbilane synthase [Sandaracinus amylolyticus]|uniref:hydroxymethylbilane synthase n=1 Tax=Sandaracinus amylolyticus TaxID=927083 RepID=UPI001F021F8F|nr:hydroxymethylbilane synthase [Sandaracinus amylolyticus]UJR78480.1 Hydroxymethylbilane synthase [Sandaracinus amylolyticus]
MKLRIATRRSPLALAQTRWVADRIRAASPGIEIEEVQLVTQGDRVLDVPLAKVGGKGLFVTEVEQALEDGRADIAVHSMKDVPEKLAAGMELICVPEREDPHDVVITKSGEGFFDLEAGTRVGTSSLRRAVQLHAARNDVAFSVLRGNVGTRLRKLDEGEYGAIVLAHAGLRRLGLAQDRKLEVLSVEHSIPAVGQGALGIEGRADDARSRALLATLEHGPTRIAVEAERAFLVALHGSCTTPLAAHARIEAGSLQIDGMVGAIDGSRIVRGGMHEWIDVAAPEKSVETARKLGRALAESLLDQGARVLIDEARASSDPYAPLYSSN